MMKGGRQRRSKTPFRNSSPDYPAGGNRLNLRVYLALCAYASIDKSRGPAQKVSRDIDGGFKAYLRLRP